MLKISILDMSLKITNSRSQPHIPGVNVCFLLFSPKVGLNFIDHIVGNQPNEAMIPATEWLVEMDFIIILD